MNKAFKTLVMAGVLLVSCAGVSVAASETPQAKAPSHSEVEDAARAQALLNRAVAAYKANPKKAMVDFSMVGPYIDNELYVFVVGENGVMRASGGPSRTLLDRDIRNLKDADGKLFIAAMLDGGKVKESGSVAYRWKDIEHGGNERKVAYFQKVGDALLAVGYYIHHSTPEEAKALLAKAVDAVKQDPKAAFAKFNDINGGYTKDDLYVFVVGINDLVMYASGTSPRLVGRKVANVSDINGKHIFPQSIEIAKAQGHGELDYTWRNPVTGMQERKISYLERAGDYAVGVGYYVPQPKK